MARIKKIMQMDEDVGKVATAVPVLVSKSLELFMQHLMEKLIDIVQRSEETYVQPAHLKQCILEHAQFDFLKDVVENVSDEPIQSAGPRRKKALELNDVDISDSSEPTAANLKPKRKKKEVSALEPDVAIINVASEPSTPSKGFSIESLMNPENQSPPVTKPRKPRTPTNKKPSSRKSSKHSVPILPSIYMSKEFLNSAVPVAHVQPILSPSNPSSATPPLLSQSLKISHLILTPPFPPPLYPTARNPQLNSTLVLSAESAALVPIHPRIEVKSDPQAVVESNLLRFKPPTSPLGFSNQSSIQQLQLPTASIKLNSPTSAKGRMDEDDDYDDI